MNEAELTEKLQRIQALFAGATSDGERAAAGAARERVEARLAALREQQPTEVAFRLTNPWSQRLLVALLRRHGFQPFRRPRQRHTTIMARMPKQYCDEVLWPEFVRLDETLVQYLDEVAARVICKAVHSDPADAAELETPALV
ncbi:MAG: hypothetical protein M9894_25605 [Planctomycetes bacterium]|nr:hypothetical protein [Planctomycetota bacterium]